jgi:hypothetical protein
MREAGIGESPGNAKIGRFPGTSRALPWLLSFRVQGFLRGIIEKSHRPAASLMW